MRIIWSRWIEHENMQYAVILGEEALSHRAITILWNSAVSVNTKLLVSGVTAPNLAATVALLDMSSFANV